MSVIHVPAVVKVWQMNSASSLVCRKHFLCEQNMGPQGCIYIIRMRSEEMCCLCINGRRRKVLFGKMLKCEVRHGVYRAKRKRVMKRLASRLQSGLLTSRAE